MSISATGFTYTKLSPQLHGLNSDELAAAELWSIQEDGKKAAAPFLERPRTISGNDYRPPNRDSNYVTVTTQLWCSIPHYMNQVLKAIKLSPCLSTGLSREACMASERYLAHIPNLGTGLHATIFCCYKFLGIQTKILHLCHTISDKIVFTLSS